MFEKIWRVVTCDLGVEKILKAFAGCKVEVLDDHSAKVEAYQSQMDIYYNDFNFGVVTK